MISIIIRLMVFLGRAFCIGNVLPSRIIPSLNWIFLKINNLEEKDKYNTPTSGQVFWLECLLLCGLFFVAITV